MGIDDAGEVRFDGDKDDTPNDFDQGFNEFVDMVERVCSCTNWELTTIRFKHVITVLTDKANNCEKVEELHTYVYRVHWLETWKTNYVYKVELIKGRAIWPICKGPIKITTPLHHNHIERPKKKK